MLRLVTLLLLLLSPLLAAQPQPEIFQLFSREKLAPMHIELSGDEWRWLRIKHELRIAVWAPELPPYLIFQEAAGSGNSVEGIYADYLQLLARNLGVQAVMVRYPSQTAAQAAVKSGAADALFSSPGRELHDAAAFRATDSFLINRPVVIAAEKQASQPVPYDAPLRLAMREGSLTDAQIKQRFPQASIVRYPSSQAALAAVASGEADYALGSLLAAAFLIERSYVNQLALAAILPQDALYGSRLVVKADNQPLLQALNAAIAAIPGEQQRLISRQWTQRPDVWRLQEPLSLTPREQQWLQQHAQVKVAFNPFSAPLALLDEQGEFQGISADLLHLIQLRTGLFFSPVPAYSWRDGVQQLEQHQVAMLAAVAQDGGHQEAVRFTRPYLKVSLVLLVPDQPDAPQALYPGMKLSIVKGNPARQTLLDRFPTLQLSEVDNASLALQLLQEGKVAGLIDNQLSVNTLLARYAQQPLKIVSRLALPPVELSFAVSRDQPELLSIIDKALADIQPSEISLIASRWQGTPQTTRTTWQLYRAQFYAISLLTALLLIACLAWVYYRGKEVKHRRRAEADLQAELRFRDALLNGLPTPVYVLDRNWNVVSANGAFQRFFAGVDAQRLSFSLYDQRHPLSPLISKLYPLMSPEAVNDPELVALAHNSLWGDTAQDLEIEIENGSEARMVHHWAQEQRDAQGNITGLICGWQDVTAYELLMLALQAEKKVADEANRAKSSFLATMSHEIRTPISAIIGLLELEGRKQRDNEAIQIAYESANTLLGLIGDILDMAKIESGQLELMPEWVSTEQLVLPVVRLFDGMASGKNLTLHYHSDTPPGLEVFIDAARFRQVIANYINNAIKFTHEGGVEVRVIGHEWEDGSLELEIEIEDSGVGISAADQAKLFQPFAQTEEGRKQTGTGLGLVISAQLLEKMQGTMNLNSQPGRGTLIQLNVMMPARRARKLLEKTRVARSRALPQLNILVVDDHPANRLLLRSQLSELGQQISEASSGEEALALLAHQAFDLIITDCNMPGMSGIELTQTLRRSGNAVKIFGLTANAQSDVRVRCLEAGMNACLFKPLKIDKLAELLSSNEPAAEVPALDSLLSLESLRAMVYHDDAMVAKMLAKVGEESRNDMQQCWRHFDAQDWPALASSLHRLGGSAQIIYAGEIDDLCGQIERACQSAEDQEVIREGLLLLEEKLDTLNQSVVHYLQAS
ncbi:transporter substrate-binding domain-containing protein [Pantoea dispersa]|uniref:response regulator n=1 Tax=Pantoea dispersa TaxID=59814 RepID=UPI0030D20346